MTTTTPIFEASTIPARALHGAGMHYGAVSNVFDGRNIYSMRAWDVTCAQAKAWGMRYVHPKVAEGALPYWYSINDMRTMKSIADNHGLLCYPMHYLYGDTFGDLTREAEMVAELGSIFGGVVMDMEDQWMNRHEWAARMGVQIRHVHNFTGLLLPTIYANPLDHPTPILEMNDWADAFLPQAYFSVWTGQSVQTAQRLMNPQWTAVANDLWHNHGKVLKPIQPIISTGNNVPLAEVEKWVIEVGPEAFYVGFWYDLTHSPYAQAIARLIPQYLSARPSPPAPTPNPISSIPTPPLQGDDPMATFQQTIDDAILKSVYRKNGRFNFDRRLGICNWWCQLVTQYPYIQLGSPKSDEQLGTFDGRPMVYIEFDSGRRIYYDKQEHKVFLI